VFLLWQKKLTYCRVRHDDHHISIGCKHINESSKITVSNFHALELSSQFTVGKGEEKQIIFKLKFKEKKILPKKNNTDNFKSHAILH
jgi:hypothetical protein